MTARSAPVASSDNVRPTSALLRLLSSDTPRSRALSAILRLAEGLDRSHSQPLAGVDVHDRGDDVLVQLRTSGDAELELWAAHRHVIPFERMLGKPVRFEIRGTTPHAEHSD